MEERRVQVTMTREEASKMLKILEGQNVEDWGQLFHHIEQRVIEDHVNPSVLFVTSYENNQVYGGPEEGGWTYMNRIIISTMPCIGCTIASPDGRDDASFNDAFDKAFENFRMIVGMEETRGLEKATVKELLMKHGYYDCDDYEIPNLHYAIEFIPGMLNDTHKHHFE